MKKTIIIFLALSLAACSTPPKLDYPTGKNKVPINIHLQNDNPNINIEYVETPSD